MAELGWTAVRVRGLTRGGGILNKCAGTPVNRSVTHNQQVASADYVDLFLPTNSKKVKRYNAYSFAPAGGATLPPLGP